MSALRLPLSGAIRAARIAVPPRAISTAPRVARTSVQPAFASFSSSAQRFEIDAAPEISASSSSSAAAAAATAAPSPITLESLASEATASTSYPYTIGRTASGELPVYSKLRRGNMWKTVIRNVKGDVPALQAELNELFAQGHIDPLTPAPVVTLRPTNRHLEVRGRWVEQVKGWLEERGF